MKLAVPLLAAAAFAMLTNEFNIIGVIPLIAHDLNVPVSKVGLLVSAFAFTVAVTGPFLTLALRRIERRLLFTAVLSVTLIGASVAALATNYFLLASGRVLSALALPVYWSMATATAARIAGPERAGSAISIVFSGVAIASVAGSPLTTILADEFGWRISFAAGGVVCGGIALLMWLFFPRIVADCDETQVSALKILSRPLFLLHLGMSLLALTAMFTSYTYLADVLVKVGRFTVASTGWLLMAFGASGIVGNAIAGKFVDAYPLRSAVVAIAVGAVAMAAFPGLLSNHGLAIAVLLVWGAAHAAGFVTNHVRTIRSAPPALQDFAASVNVSIFNAGIGLGAVVGGKVIDAVGLKEVGVAGAMSGALALVGAGLIHMVSETLRGARSTAK
ncbi:MFS transporter [Caballeronia novacaledonica]|uniref:MFS transporter n=1 Tax=Caballeronia novacaledonica TaxID=1544861 RepID=A0AA37IHV0_9BURK|nr:MFS transporter [Caballeronia novacaledonica]GJH28989.1 MFS transporter [Caballeronia novacaledonica]